MAWKPKSMRPIGELVHQRSWTVYEFAELHGCSHRYIYTHMVDIDRRPVEKVADLPADGHVWVDIGGVLIPARKNHNGHLIFIASHVRAAEDDARPPQPAQADS